MSIAVTGANGQLGLELCRQLGSRATPLARPSFDLTDSDGMSVALRKLRPQAVINCAAYTQVDRAETEVDACRAINANSVAHLAEICNDLNCPLVQISTDYVFGDPVAAGPHGELAPINPQGVYARTKAEGETAAMSAGRNIVIRTCGLYGHTTDKPNFVKTMLRLGRERPRLTIVADQHCTPTSVIDVARAAIFLLDSSSWGLYHVVNAGYTTWFDFAAEIFHQAAISVELAPITSEEYNAPAPRPRDSRLDCTKYIAQGGPAMSRWQDALSVYLKSMRA